MRWQAACKHSLTYFMCLFSLQIPDVVVSVLVRHEIAPLLILKSKLIKVPL